MIMKGNLWNSKGMVYVIAFAIVLVWGCTFVQTKVLLNAGLRPDEIFLFRFILAFCLDEIIIVLKYTN